MDYAVEGLVAVLSRQRFSLQTESYLQQEIANILTRYKIEFQREYVFDEENRIDFFLANGLGMEVKIKGGAKSIYKQCERYCRLPELKTLILVTNRAMGFPTMIWGKPTYVVQLGKGWL